MREEYKGKSKMEAYALAARGGSAHLRTADPFEPMLENPWPDTFPLQRSDRQFIFPWVPQLSICR